ncbi:MAG: hypothetical protein IJW12_05105 [Opitutales bacterium]|nr:hypothetical protein [Opitutales bacterium]
MASSSAFCVASIPVMENFDAPRFFSEFSKMLEIEDVIESDFVALENVFTQPAPNAAPRVKETATPDVDIFTLTLSD